MDTIQQTQPKKKTLITEYVGLGINLAGWVSVPVLAGFFLGHYLTETRGLPIYVFYICITLSVVLSFYGLIKESKQYVKKLELEEKIEAAQKEFQNIPDND